jgi:hypothetical protein
MHAPIRNLMSSPIDLFPHCRIKSIIEFSIVKGVDIALQIWPSARKPRNITTICFARNHTASSLLNYQNNYVRNTIFYIKLHPRENETAALTLFTGSEFAFAGFLA